MDRPLPDRPGPALPDVLEIDSDSISSAVLRRLVREIQEDAQLRKRGAGGIDQLQPEP